MRKRYIFVHNGYEYLQLKHRQPFSTFFSKLGDYSLTRVATRHAVYKQGKHFRPRR
jgi:ribosomal protein S19